MKYYPTKFEADIVANQNQHPIGQKLSPPFSSYPITSITVEKAKKHQGYIVVLSHDVFDGGWAEITNFRCPQVELDDYLDVMIPPYL